MLCSVISVCCVLKHASADAEAHVTTPVHKKICVLEVNMVSLILLIIFVGDIEHDFSFTVDVILTLSLAGAIVLEEWVTEDYIGPITKRLLKRIATIWHNLPFSVYVSFRVFCHLRRHTSLIPATKVATKFALRLINDGTNYHSLKRRNVRKT